MTRDWLRGVLGSAALVAMMISLACFGGGSSGADSAVIPPPRSCLTIEAGENLNLFDGQPHVVVLYFFPLQNAASFQSADLRDLASGVKPSGLAGEPWEATVLPGQKLELREPLPRDTANLGVLADFYRGPRKALVSVACSGETIVLSSSDMAVVQPVSKSKE